MSAGQKSGRGATGNLDDGKARKGDQGPPEGDNGVSPENEGAKTDKIDRPGFDLGGSTGDTSAGTGLGLGKDAKESRKGWGVPRQR